MRRDEHKRAITPQEQIAQAGVRGVLEWIPEQMLRDAVAVLDQANAKKK